MNRLLLTLFIFFLSLGIFAQNNSSHSVAQSNQDYFSIPRETLFLHLDKSVYVNGEEIWFKGYAYDRQKSLPSVGSTNFNVQVFNEEGKELYDGLFFGSRGSFRGNIKIDSTWSDGDYYIRVSTNWMNNFVEDESYIKKIKILSSSIIADEASKPLAYDFQLLPEGGHLVSGTDNSVGFKLLNNLGYGVSFDRGYIVDDQGNEITSFSSNQFGIGKFSIRPELGKQYKAVIRFRNSKEITHSFPKIHATGMAISINNMIEDYAMVEVNTNKETLAFGADDYYLLIRQNHLSKQIPLRFLPDEIKKKISLRRAILFPGINTITLFKDNTPVAERLLFNSIDDHIANTLSTSSRTIKDSLSIDIRMPKKQGVRYDVSVSILPEATKSYTPKDNIYSAVLLHPYVQGFIEDEQYYFRDMDRKKMYNLDLLLVTQGWSRYSWDRIFNTVPKVVCGFNQGFKLKGKVQGRKKKDIDKIYMHPTIYQKGSFIEVGTDKSFEIPNFFPEKGEEVELSGVTSGDVFVKPVLYVQVVSEELKKPFGSVLLSDDNMIENTVINTEVEIPEDFITDNVQVLDEVVLVKKKEEENTNTIRILPYFKRNSTKITQDLADYFPSVIDYIISTRKYQVFIGPNRDIRILSLALNEPVAVLIDDFQLSSDLSALDIMRTSEVDRIYMDRMSYALGTRGGLGGSIRIYTRKIPLGSEIRKKNSVMVCKMTKGFEPVKEYYNPGYSNYLDVSFIDYGVIHWQPWVDFDKKGFGTFKIPNTELEHFTLYIEGMGSDGSLISEIKTIKIENPN